MFILANQKFPHSCFLVLIVCFLSGSLGVISKYHCRLISVVQYPKAVRAPRHRSKLSRTTTSPCLQNQSTNLPNHTDTHFPQSLLPLAHLISILHNCQSSTRQEHIPKANSPLVLTVVTSEPWEQLPDSSKSQADGKLLTKTPHQLHLSYQLVRTSPKTFPC